MNNANRPLARLLLAALAGTVLTSAALAQSAAVAQPKEAPKAMKLKGSLDKPIGTRSAAGAQNGSQTVHVVVNSNDDSGSYTITIDNDEISASVNGQPVPADRIERKDNVVIIKDENGKTIKVFDVGMVGGHGAFVGGQHGSAFAPLGGGDWSIEGFPEGQTLFSAAAPAEPPPVMVGITMSEPDPTLLEHLGLESGTAFMIDRVIDGLPASAAGVKAYDLVVQIDGTKPATQERFRETLKDKKPGDKLDLTVIRKGKEQHVVLKLVAYDASKFGESVPQGGEYAPAGRLLLTPNWMGDQTAVAAEARKHIEEALKSLRDNPDLQPDKVRKQASEALEQALNALKDSKDALAQRYYQFRNSTPGQQDVIVGNRPGQVFAVPGQPAVPTPPDRDMEKRIERLNSVLEKLDRRLDEIEKRLEKSGR